MSGGGDAAVLARFKTFYEHYCPQDVSILHVVLASYAGRENALMERLVKKYGPEEAAIKAQRQPAPQAPSSGHSTRSKPEGGIAKRGSASSVKQPSGPENRPSQGQQQLQHTQSIVPGPASRRSSGSTIPESPLPFQQEHTLPAAASLLSHLPIASPGKPAFVAPGSKILDRPERLPPPAQQQTSPKQSAETSAASDALENHGSGLLCTADRIPLPFQQQNTMPTKGASPALRRSSGVLSAASDTPEKRDSCGVSGRPVQPSLPDQQQLMRPPMLASPGSKYSSAGSEKSLKKQGSGVVHHPGSQHAFPATVNPEAKRSSATLSAVSDASGSHAEHKKAANLASADVRDNSRPTASTPSAFANASPHSAAPSQPSSPPSVTLSYAVRSPMQYIAPLSRPVSVVSSASPASKLDNKHSTTPSPPAPAIPQHATTPTPMPSSAGSHTLNDLFPIDRDRVEEKQTRQHTAAKRPSPSNVKRLSSPAEELARVRRAIVMKTAALHELQATRPSKTEPAAELERLEQAVHRMRADMTAKVDVLRAKREQIAGLQHEGGRVGRTGDPRVLVEAACEELRWFKGVEKEGDGRVRLLELELANARQAMVAAGQATERRAAELNDAKLALQKWAVPPSSDVTGDPSFPDWGTPPPLGSHRPPMSSGSARRTHRLE